MKKLMILIVATTMLCGAAPKHVEQQAANLQTILRQADDAYYNKNESIMGDVAYDALRGQYDRLVAEYPELAEAQPVGAPVADSPNRIVHSTPILSLQKAYSNDEVLRFIEKCATNQLYNIEPKIDGLTVVLTYRNGLLTQATTRGDGKTGTDITAAILASGAVTAALSHTPELFEVRGEAYLPLSAFDALNERRENAGKLPLKSPRNTAAGTLRLNDYAEIANRSLKIHIFELLATDPMPPTHTEALALIESAGLPVIPSRTVIATDVLDSIAKLNRKRAKLPFSTDGIVIRIDDRATFERLGKTAHHPRGTLARKYKETPVETHLLSVDWTRGATGKITPIARFEPVEIQGATVQSATLHNVEHIRAMDLRIGDWINVIRAGGTVPEIIGNHPDRRTGNEIQINAPD